MSQASVWGWRRGDAGEEDHGEGGVEEFEEPGDLLDHGVVAAGLEEGRPVPLSSFDEVLATRRVGQDAVDVEDHGRPAGVRHGAPGVHVQLIRSSSGLVSGTNDQPKGLLQPRRGESS